MINGKMEKIRKINRSEKSMRWLFVIVKIGLFVRKFFWSNLGKINLVVIIFRYYLVL